jgi:hypothetical protein
VLQQASAEDALCGRGGRRCEHPRCPDDRRRIWSSGERRFETQITCFGLSLPTIDALPFLRLRHGHSNSPNSSARRAPRGQHRPWSGSGQITVPCLLDLLYR